jgi:hypothetical protein
MGWHLRHHRGETVRVSGEYGRGGVCERDEEMIGTSLPVSGGEGFSSRETG